MGLLLFKKAKNISKYLLLPIKIKAEIKKTEEKNFLEKCVIVKKILN